ncbi:MAG: hypothetical protein R3C24_03620 [Cyanobacteriota/Melainabacteria group bacterium]
MSSPIVAKHEEAFTELHSISREDRESEWYKVQGDIYRKAR